jgi:hypothetical protein
MEFYDRLSDPITSVTINLMEINKKYVIVHANRFRNTSHPIIKLTIQHSEDERLDIFLDWRFSELFTATIIDSINTDYILSILIFKGLDESAQYYVIGYE